MRFLSGQTNSADDVLVTDEEITFCLAESSQNEYQAAALACDALAARYRAYPTQESVGQLGLTWGERGDGFSAQAATLRTRGLLAGVAPYVGGQSVSDKQVDEEDTDNVVPGFRRGMDNNPTASWVDANGGTRE